MIVENGGLKGSKGERNDENSFSIISEPPCFRETKALKVREMMKIHFQSFPNRPAFVKQRL